MLGARDAQVFLRRPHDKLEAVGLQVFLSYGELPRAFHLQHDAVVGDGMRSIKQGLLKLVSDAP